MNQPVGKALEPDEVIDGQHTTRQDAVDEVMGQRIFFSVGEPSGDLHAANLIECMRRMDPTTRVRGFGGSKMIQAGLDLDFDLTSMAVVGISEVLPKLREFFRIADIAEGCFRRGEVDGVVLVDFPGFNWHIENARRSKVYRSTTICHRSSRRGALGVYAKCGATLTMSYVTYPLNKSGFNRVE